MTVKQAYQAGFQIRLVKEAQLKGPASDIASTLLEQPMIKDIAAKYIAQKTGELAKLMQQINMLKGQAAPLGDMLRR